MAGALGILPHSNSGKSLSTQAYASHNQPVTYIPKLGAQTLKKKIILWFVCEFPCYTPLKPLGQSGPKFMWGTDGSSYSGEKQITLLVHDPRQPPG